MLLLNWLPPDLRQKTNLLDYLHWTKAKCFQDSPSLYVLYPSVNGSGKILNKLTKLFNEIILKIIKTYDIGYIPIVVFSIPPTSPQCNLPNTTYHRVCTNMSYTQRVPYVEQNVFGGALVNQSLLFYVFLHSLVFFFYNYGVISSLSTYVFESPLCIFRLSFLV